MGRTENVPAYLCRAAKAVNCLAHQLSGAQRSIGFQVKADLISVLLVAFDGEGLIRINGVQGDILGLDIITDDGPLRLHIPLFALSPEARLVARQLSMSAPAVSSLAERLRPDQRGLLTKPRRASHVAVRDHEMREEN